MAQAWLQVDDFPSTPHDDGVAFVLGDRAYCGTGLQIGWIETRDFYAYNLLLDSWETAASMPQNTQRQYACGFSAGNRGYVFGGVGSGSYLNDMWIFDPETGNCFESTPLPGPGRSGSAVFVVENTAYIVGGKTESSDATDEVWAFNTIDQSWEEKNAFPFGGRFRASAIALAGKGYLLFGKDENNLFPNAVYTYQPETDTWWILSEFPGPGRSHAALIATDDFPVLMGGVDDFGTYYQSLWKLNIMNGQWEQLDDLPAEGRKGGMTFSHDQRLYYSTGINAEDERLKETWKYDLPVSIEKVAAQNEYGVYPNPASDKLTLKMLGDGRGSKHFVVICSTEGKEWLHRELSGSVSVLNVSHLPCGLYLIYILTDQRLVVEKLLISRP